MSARTTDSMARESYSVVIENLSDSSIIISYSKFPFSISYHHNPPFSILATSHELISTREFVQPCYFRKQAKNKQLL